jgi:hypothetical protein
MAGPSLAHPHHNLAQVRLVGEFRVSFAEFFTAAQRVAADHNVDTYDLLRRVVRTPRWYWSL